MKVRFGLRIPSLKKRIAARLSLKRYLRHNLGLKAPRGFGWITNPRRALYNRIYYRTTRGCGTRIIILGIGLGTCIAWLSPLIR